MSPKFEQLDARRLTGPSLLFDDPAAVLDVRCRSDDGERFVPAWRDAVARMLAEFPWPAARFGDVRLTTGISVGFTAPIDALYAATAINEWAFGAAVAGLAGGDPPDFEAGLQDAKTALAEEARPGLLALQRAARQHRVTMLWDDDAVSLGLGRHSRTWPAASLPAADALEWGDYADVPIGLVTGTNGKTTTVRLAQHICRGAGLSVGLSSTDWIAVNDRIIDRDDWSGPGGARTVLREADVDVAILETARGGLLRRGLGVERADVALITNIAEDHLGDFGSETIDELLAIKWVVSRPVRGRGRLVLNADDDRLVARAADYDGDVVWFSLDAASPVVGAHTGTVFVLHDGVLRRRDGSDDVALVDVADVPVTMHGAALHNVANALAAAALTHCLGIDDAAIGEGLATMAVDANPGRGNLYEVDGFTVLVDFAHNPHAIRALFSMAAALPANRRALCFGHAGDRPDALLREMARDAAAIGLDRVVISELADYYRGRGPGEVHAVLRDELIRCGIRDSDVLHFDTEVESFRNALDWAGPGDLVIMLALADADGIRAEIGSRSGVG